MEKENKSGTCTHHGRNIEFWRLFNRLTQRELADLIGLNQNQVSKLEKDEVVDEDTLLKISGALGMDVASLKRYNHKHILNTCKGVVNYIYNVHDGGILNKVDSVEDGGAVENSETKVVNPLDKICELYEQNKELAVRNAILEERLKNGGGK